MEVEKWSLDMRASNCVKKRSKISAFKGRLGLIKNDLQYWVKEIQLLLILSQPLQFWWVVFL